MMSRFDKLAERVAREYEKKGYTRHHAEEIGQETAGKVYWERKREGKEG